MRIISKSPTRVDLAGGTLDLWPLYSFFESAQTTNVAISIFTSAEITTRNDDKVVIESKDLNLKKEYLKLQDCLLDADPQLKLIRTILAHFRPEVGFELVTHSQSPIGGGLGGSSSLTISIIQAFSKWQKINQDVYGRVNLAHNLEAFVLRTPTGTQDYFPALVGGVNILNYGFNGVEVEPVKSASAWFDENCLLVYTGKPHQSGLNNWQVLKEIIDGKVGTNKALQELKVVAERVAIACREKRFNELPALLNDEYSARVALSEVFVTPDIRKIRDSVLKLGAEAVKICGAGGGGCILIWVPQTHRKMVAQQCQKDGFQILDVRCETQGNQVELIQ